MAPPEIRNEPNIDDRRWTMDKEIHKRIQIVLVIRYLLFSIWYLVFVVCCRFIETEYKMAVLPSFISCFVINKLHPPEIITAIYIKFTQHSLQTLFRAIKLVEGGNRGECELQNKKNYG